MTADNQPVLYVVACGGPPAAQLDAFAGFAQQHGWDVCVIATPDGTKFLDAERLAELTGHPVRSQYKQPDDPDVLPPADAFVVAPGTFSTINRLALGISDTLALGLLNEGLGAACRSSPCRGRTRRWPGTRPFSAAWPCCGSGECG